MVGDWMKFSTSFPLPTSPDNDFINLHIRKKYFHVMDPLVIKDPKYTCIYLRHEKL